jgi:hypothetical protein
LHGGKDVVYRYARRHILFPIQNRMKAQDTGIERCLHIGKFGVLVNNCRKLVAPI